MRPAAVPDPPRGGESERLRRLVAATSRWCVQSYLPQAVVERGGAPAMRDDGDDRPVSAAALSLAVALRLDALHPDVAAADARAAAVSAVVATARGHVSAGGGWGRSWQSPLSSGQLGLAAWLVADALSAEQRDAVLRVVRDEAEQLAGGDVHYLRDASGRVLTPGDTGAEEESWRARGLSIALALLPDDPSAQRWFRWQVVRQLAAFARPSDLLRTDLLHRTPVCAWLAGSNMEPDGSLVNHGFLPNPNYMRPVHSLVAVTQQRLAGQPVSPSALSGLDALYTALRRSYREDGRLHYPAGTDVRSRAVVLYANDVQHRALGLGGEHAPRWERLHGTIAERQLQPDGRVEEPGGTEPFGPVHPDIAGKLAEALLSAALGPVRPEEVDGERLAGPVPQRLPTACPPGGRTFADTAGATAAAASWADGRGLLLPVADDRFAPGSAVDRLAAVLSVFRAAVPPGRPSTAPAHPFRDAPRDGSEADLALRWAVDAGVVRGTSASTFSPDRTVTRGQAVLLLWRERGRPAAPPSRLLDVRGELADAVAWAVAAGVTAGVSATDFAPSRPITRGQWAVMLHREHAVG